MFMPRVFCHISRKVYFSTKTAIPMVSKAEEIRRINHENQLIFGDLLETQKERRKRLSKSLKTDSLHTTPADKESVTFEKSVATSDLCAFVAESEELPLECTKKKSTNSKKRRKKKNDDEKANETVCETKTKIDHHENKGIIQVSMEAPLSKQPSELKKDTEGELNSCETDSDISQFALENEDKAALQIKLDSELIVGRNITKSDRFYKYPSVTRILNLTMSEASKSALFRWRSKMIAEMGEEKFQEFHAKQLHLGSLFHSSLQEHLQLTPRTVSTLDPELEGCWKSLEKVLPRVAEVKLLESHVVHEKLKYRGVIDCIAVYRDSPFIIEWKKSSKSKSNLAMTYDAPVQLAAYVGALNHDSSYPFKVLRGLVVVAYSDGASANVFPLSPSELQLHWKTWMERYKKFTDMVEIDSS